MQLVSEKEKKEIKRLLESQEKIPSSVKSLVENQLQFFAELMYLIRKKD